MGDQVAHFWLVIEKKTKTKQKNKKTRNSIKIEYFEWWWCNPQKYGKDVHRKNATALDDAQSAIKNRTKTDTKSGSVEQIQVQGFFYICKATPQHPVFSLSSL